LIQALKAGILVTLGDYGYLHMLDKTPHLDAILSEFPRHLYNYSVLRHVEKAMEDLKKADHVLTVNLRGPVWSTFFRMVKGKLALRKVFEVRYKSMKFCDNIAVRVRPIIHVVRF
jgi:hypothetical protein